MKTALEWLNAVGEAAAMDMFVSNTGAGSVPGSLTEEVIKQIQQDAWQQGMLDAAEIAGKQQTIVISPFPYSPITVYGGFCADAVLTKIKTKP